MVNSHIETCLLTDDSALNNSNYIGQESNQADANNVIPASNARAGGRGNQRYIWIKKVEAGNKTSWEKVVAKSTKTGDHLENMSIESAKELSFEDKKKWLKLQMDKIRIPWVCGADYLTISHKTVLESALKNMRKVHLHKEVKIVFDEEKNVNDAGGLLREFVHLILTETFSSEKELFARAQTEEVIYHINPKAQDSAKNLELYNLVGKVIGKAVFEQISVEVPLDRFIMRQILQSEFTLDDLLSYDTQLYNSLKFIQETSIDGEDVFEEYFVAKSPLDGEDVELIPNGKDIKITDANKTEYIQLMLDWLGKKSIETKLNSFFDGLFTVLPKDVFQALTIEELEMAFYGLPFIDLNDWENTTLYKGAYYKNHQIVKWFWEVMKELNQEQLSKFFYFCTGSTRAPVDGFSTLQSNRGEVQRFTIESIKNETGNSGLKAHTCFNRLELPMYQNKEAVKGAIQTVLTMDFNGVFGLE